MDDTRTRYDWLVDGQPTSLSYTEAGDVPGGVEVGVQFEATDGTPVPEASTGLLVDGPAPGAFLAGVPCVDVDHGLPDALGLVINEPLKLAEGPVAECLVESLSQLLLLSDAELFQRYRIERLCHYPVGYLVVHVGHEAFLLLRHALEFALGGAGAFGLEFRTKVLVAALDRTNVIGIIELVVREDRMVEYASIDPEDGGRGPDAGRPLLHHDAKDELRSVEQQLGGHGLPTSVFFEVFGNVDWNFDPSVDAGQGNITPSKSGSEGSLIVTDGRPLLLGREPFQLFSLEHLRGGVPCGADEGGRDAWIPLPSRVVCQVVELQLVDHSCLESYHENVISGGVDGFDGFNKPLVSREMESDGALHEISLGSKVYLNIAPIPPTFEKVGFLGGSP
jgi:hypothetical protein